MTSKNMKKALKAVSKMRGNHAPCNVRRAQWAKNALEVFTVETYGGDVPDDMDHGDLETAVQDLVSDLMHYWTQHRHADDPTAHDVVERAARLYQEEIDDPEPEETYEP